MSAASPVIVSAAAAQRLPRWVLPLLALLSIAPGLIGREAWKPFDGVSIAIMLELAQGHANWLQPSLLGQAAPEPAWLPYWLGAWSIQMLPWLDAVTASRLPQAAALALTLAGTWYASFSLALQRSAQPLAFAFGGHADALAYARAVADTATLVLLACLGLAVMGHESSPHPYAMAASAWLLHAGADAQRQPSRGWRWLLRWLIPTLALLASGAPAAAVLLGAWAARPAAPASLRHWLRFAAQALLLLLLYTQVAWPQSAGAYTTPLGAALGSAIRSTAWQAWPAWPLALLGLWRWRRHLRQAHIAVPLGASTLLWLAALSSGAAQRQLLPVLPALAALAGLAIPSVRRTALALVDWLALLMFSLCGVAIWVYAVAMASGWPAPAARAVARLLPTLAQTPAPLAWLFAAVVTSAWLAALIWRTRAHRVALWKGLVLSATGTTWCWALLMSLWLPALNLGMSYDPLARRIHAAAAAQTCLASIDLPAALNAALLRTGTRPQVDSTRAHECDALVTLERNDVRRFTAAQWQAIATLPQARPRNDALRVYRRVTQ